ncbi:MAG: hypothetical protein KDC36_07255 [Thermoleophilia bacterium]|nr:hypothetical protein [Thermoleophilia bacterium]
MTIDLPRARDFMTTHARILDQRRFALMFGGAAEAVLRALDAYRNPDGGYGSGLEPDLRSPESQPAAAHHAFEAFQEAAVSAGGRASTLCDWLAGAALEDGGLPMALPVGVAAGTARWWIGADPGTSSLQITSVATAAALAVAARDPSVANHPWLARSVGYCLAAIEALDAAPPAYVLAFSLRLADALHPTRPADAERVRDQLSRYVPDSGAVPVAGGTEGETLHLLDLSPTPGTPSRELFSGAAVARDLDRLAGLQRPDGGWEVDYASASVAGALEWRGYATVRAVRVLIVNGMVGDTVGTNAEHPWPGR